MSLIIYFFDGRSLLGNKCREGISLLKDIGAFFQNKKNNISKSSLLSYLTKAAHFLQGNVNLLTCVLQILSMSVLTEICLQ